VILPQGTPLLGDVLVEAALVKRDRFEAALAGYRPDRDGRIGDYLVRANVVSREAIETVVLRQRQPQVAPPVTPVIPASEIA